MSVPYAWRSCFSDIARPAPRAATGRAFARLREVAPATDAELSEALSLAVGHVISPATIAAWCDPDGPKPPAHWLVALAQLVGPSAARVLAELVQ